MMDLHASRAIDWADNVHSSVGCFTPPIDLLAVARFRRIKRAGFRLMVNRGVLVPVGGGFEVYLRDLDSRDIDIEGAEPETLLSPRQRFTFAHEIIHTFFYKTSSEVPAPTGVVKNPLKLEEICDRAALRLLVPTPLLRREIRKELGDSRRIDSDFIRAVTVKFRTSYEVMIERLRAVESENTFARCILLVRKNKGEALTTASYLGLGLISTLSTPKKYQPVANWFSGFPSTIVEGEGDGRWEVTVSGRELVFAKTPLGRSGDFILQIDDPRNMAPISKEQSA